MRGVAGHRRGRGVAGIRWGNIGTLGASGSAARLCDEAQFTYGGGPCLDAASGRVAVVVTDLADPIETRWPAYGPAMLHQQIHGVYALPIMVGGQYVGALDVFQAEPMMLAAEQLAGVAAAAELAQMPMLDPLEENLNDAVTPGSHAWNEFNALARAEVAQATGMVMAQLNIGRPAALVRLRAYAYATVAAPPTSPATSSSGACDWNPTDEPLLPGAGQDAIRR